MRLSGTQQRIIGEIKESAGGSMEYWDIVNYANCELPHTPIERFTVQRSLDALIRRGVVVLDQDFGECQLAESK